MSTVYRVRALLRIDPASTASVLTGAHAITNGLAADPKLFSAPNPLLGVLDAQIAKVDASEQLAATRVKGAASARNVERQALVGMLETERSYVQTLCDATPAKAAAIVEAAGMFVAPVATRNTPILKATCGSQPGTANLDAYATALVGRSGKKVFYNWQWTTDGGKTFNTAPSTPHARTTIGGLTPLTTVGFRVSVTDTQGTGPWTDVVAILIL